MSSEQINPVGRPVIGAVQLPGSKSLTNRALVAAGLAAGESRLDGCLRSDDTGLMAEAWRRLGAEVDWPAGSTTVTVRGVAGRLRPGPLELFVGNAGTVMRFLTAVVAAGRGRYRLDGAPRMRERPIADLLDAMRELGLDAASEGRGGCPPVVVNATGLPGGRVTVSGRTSSQYLSGLLLAAPTAARDLEIVLDGELVSKPYTAMTCRLMADFGVAVDWQDYTRFRVPAPQLYRGRVYQVEPDATAATYFWAAAAITGGAVTVAGLGADSAQGDVGFVRVLEEMGCRTEESPAGLTVRGPERLRGGREFDLNAMPDTALTLAVAALFADGPTTIRNVANLRVKETDRLAALATELRKLGAAVDELSDGLRIAPPVLPDSSDSPGSSSQPGRLRGAAIATYDDHRMAMSFALAGLRVSGVEITGAECVSKTFPDYFGVLRKLVGQE